ncbi:MAG: ClpXP protease specificity-enhancing factor [Pseudomonadota bacterium]
MAEISTRPYLIRALYEWCADSGFTPQLLVAVDSRTRVPPGFVKDGQIVLNISAGATRNLTLDNDWIQFSARFGGVSHEIAIPVDRVAAIFARENGQGLHFEPAGAPPADAAAPAAPTGPDEPPSPSPPKGRPALKVVK